MNGFIVWCPGRCGSMLATKILRAALYPKEPITITQTKYVKNANSSVVHTHNLRMFYDSSARRVMMVRDIFPAVVSLMIAFNTKQYHISNADESDRYVYEFGNTPIHINVKKFENYCRLYDQQFDHALTSPLEFDKVHYEQIEDDPFKLLGILKIDKKLWNMKSLITTNITRKIPVPKDKQVSNYQELLDKFDRLELKHKRMMQR